MSGTTYYQRNREVMLNRTKKKLSMADRRQNVYGKLMGGLFYTGD